MKKSKNPFFYRLILRIYGWITTSKSLRDNLEIQKNLPQKIEPFRRRVLSKSSRDADFYWIGKRNYSRGYIPCY
jgi:hypothetical protein